jgi:2,5-diamino-6-(ribosylamino)-4(3H)-pyrimidinone 5'-phosphate reductase
MRGDAARVVLFTTERTPVAERAGFAAAGAEVIVLGDRRVDLVAALRHLADTGVRRLLVEGGGTLVEALLRDGLVDEITLYVAPLILGGVDAPTPAEGPGFSIDHAVRLRLIGTETLGDGGLVLSYQVVKGGSATPDASNTPNEEG